jgi:hypothetical protein
MSGGASQGGEGWMMKRCCFGFCVRRACSAAEEGVASQRLNGGLHPSAPTRKEPLNAAVLSSWLLVPGLRSEANRAAILSRRLGTSVGGRTHGGTRTLRARKVGECSSLGPRFYDQLRFDGSSVTPPLRWMATFHPEQESLLEAERLARIQLMILSKAGAREGC